ncbi:hypothetical protein CR513_61040, partial [Mucuna pruriens]
MLHKCSYHDFTRGQLIKIFYNDIFYSTCPLRTTFSFYLQAMWAPSYKGKDCQMGNFFTKAVEETIFIFQCQINPYSSRYNLEPKKGNKSHHIQEWKGVEGIEKQVTPPKDEAPTKEIPTYVINKCKDVITPEKVSAISLKD